MIFGYTRVSTTQQITEGQKNQIRKYCMDHRLFVDQWIDIEISSRASLYKRRIEELLDSISEGDTIITTELSRLGRSIKEVLQIIEEIVTQRNVRLICIKQQLDLNPDNQNEPINKILITIFSMMAELERDFISERTKAGLQARKEKGIILGKPKGIIQKSMYDKDHEKIKQLYELGVPIAKIIDTHLKYGKYLSLKVYIEKRIKKKQQNS